MQVSNTFTKKNRLLLSRRRRKMIVCLFMTKDINTKKFLSDFVTHKVSWVIIKT